MTPNIKERRLETEINTKQNIIQNIGKFDKMGGVINGVENSKSVHSNTSNTSKRDTAAVIE